MSLESQNLPKAPASSRRPHLAIWIIAAVLILTVAAIWWSATRNRLTVSGQRIININVSDEKITSATTISAHRGERLSFYINSKNATDELDFVIPGYNLSTTFSKNSVGNLEFTASLAGSFAINLRDEDGATKTVGKLVVKQ